MDVSSWQPWLVWAGGGGGTSWRSFHNGKVLQEADDGREPAEVVLDKVLRKGGETWNGSEQVPPQESHVVYGWLKLTVLKPTRHWSSLGTEAVRLACNTPLLHERPDSATDVARFTRRGRSFRFEVDAFSTYFSVDLRNFIVLPELLAKEEGWGS